MAKVHEIIKTRLDWCEVQESREFCIVTVPLPNRFNTMPGDNLLALWGAMERIDEECGVSCIATMLKPSGSKAVFELTWDEV